MDFERIDVMLSVGLVAVMTGLLVLLIAAAIPEYSCQDGVLPSYASNCSHPKHEMVLPKRGDPSVVVCRCREGE